MRFETVALIDDNEDDNFIHRRYLQRAGWANRIVEYPDALAALGVLRVAERLPDLLFVDLNMPEMTGSELLDAMLGLGRDLSPCRIVVLTSSLHPDDRKRAEQHPLVRAYVEKPLNIAALDALREKIP